jgi:hypothetical protein
VNDEKFKDLTYMANAINNLFAMITERLNIQHVKKEDAIPILRFISWKFPQHKNNPNHRRVCIP